MKKHLLLILVLAASLTTSAQDNLALTGTALATSEAGGNTAKNAIDGDVKTTRWESNHDDNESWQLDLGSVKDFNTIQIVWEGAYAESFNIMVGNTVGTDGYLTDGTQVASVTGQKLSDLTQTLSFAKASARYVKFTGIARTTTQWGKFGYSFYEFRVLNVTSQTLTTFSVAPTSSLKNSATTAGIASAGKVGAAIPLTVKALDQNNLDYPATDVSYSVEGAGGTVSGGAFTPSAKGISTVTATLGDKTSTFKVFAYDGDNLAVGKLVDKSGEVAGYLGSYAVDGDNGTRWGSGAPSGAGHDYNAYLTLDLAAYYDIDYVDLFFENANAADYTVQFSMDGKSWTNAYAESGLAGFQSGHYGYCGNITDNKQVRFVKFNSTKAATDYGVSLWEMAVYGCNKTDITDVEAPVLNTAETASIGKDNVTLKLQATDNISSIVYVIKDAANGKEYTTTGANGSAVSYKITGLNDGTAYSFDVVAKDANGNVSNTKPVTFTTLAMCKPAVAAQTPALVAADVKSVFGEHYVSVVPSAGFDTWGSGGESLSSYLVAEGDHAERVNNFGYLGFDFGGGTTIENMSDMLFLHFDVYPENDFSIGVTPIVKTSGGSAENGKQYAVKAKQWNSLDIPLTDFTNGKTDMDMSKVFQIKWYGGDGQSLIYLDNIYFSKTDATGISNMSACDATSTSVVNVYGVDGRLVKHNVSANAVKGLTKGIYIVNGNKMIVK